jgi:hypothetical protein
VHAEPHFGTSSHHQIFAQVFYFQEKCCRERASKSSLDWLGLRSALRPSSLDNARFAISETWRCSSVNPSEFRSSKYGKTESSLPARSVLWCSLRSFTAGAKHRPGTENWEQIGNKLGTNYQRTTVNQIDQPIRKLLRSKDELVFSPAHNPKVVSSNLTPATNFLDSRAGSQDPGPFVCVFRLMSLKIGLSIFLRVSQKPRNSGPKVVSSNRAAATNF